MTNININKTLAITTIAFALSSCGAQSVSERNTEERFVDSVVARMDIKQKIGQLVQFTSSDNIEEMENIARSGMMGSILNDVNPEHVNRLQKAALESPSGIPVLIGRDVIHGYKTIFPIPLGQAATFDTALVRKGSEISALEATADGIKWTFSPMLDIARDPRWGRIAEGYGEDPYLTSVMGEAAIRGYQANGNLTKNSAIAACAKHFVGYGASTSGRDYNSTYIPMNQLHNVYLPPFEAAVKAGVQTFMSSFNDNDGVPSTGNKYILDDVLRGMWNFDGFVVSDWNSVGEMINHGFCSDPKDAAYKAITAGLDMDMVSNCYLEQLENLLQEGKISEQLITERCKNIVRVKYRLGLFQNPYIVTSQDVKYAPEHLAAAQKAAEESAVLIKNVNNTLPITKAVKRILVTGPMADAPHDQLGTWVFDGDKHHTVTVLKALQDNENYQVTYIPAITYSRDKNTKEIAKAVAAAKNCDLILFVGGEESILSGEAHCLANLNLQGTQSQLLESLKKTNKPVVAVIMAGRPLTIKRDLENCDAMIYMFHPGTMGGPALVNILNGEVNPSGKLPVTFPISVGQIPTYYGKSMTGRPADGTETLLNDIPAEAGQTSLGCTTYHLDDGFHPLLPFGYGLSYTNFEYKDLLLSGNTFKQGDEIKVKCKVSNVGERDGATIVQLYVRDLVASIVRPVLELKDFKRVEIPAGQTIDVEFSLPVSRLEFYNLDNKMTLEPGKFKLWIAQDSNLKDALETEFEIK
ncbi:MAG: glycoside hydrolase family 3 C-terminal domain-containing protein [Bacteroidales bacterium]|nr:glycoside hydrolase family 3 C-terminal domain-containing protein [Bacteroidales bacterium]